MTPSSACLDLIREQVGRALAEFLARQRDVLVSAGQELLPALDAMSGLLARGKRLRPAFCYWGWRGAGGQDRPEIMAAAAALELLHAGALIHDDVMDASETRRGQPALHRRFAARHADSGWRGSADGFGTGTAILLGDLLLCWTDEMFRASGLPPEAIRRAEPVLDRMRTEVIAGQYLDLLGQAAGNEAAASALRVVEFKTAKYTIERPLQLGAALAGPEDDALSRAYSGYGLPLGTAFQLRDDILGMFGNPAQTGKPTGDDLRAGKRTVLLATALARASSEQAAVIDRHLGDPMLDQAGTAEVQAVIAATGALAECERMIDAKVRDALAALSAAPVAPEVRSALTELAIAATVRRD